jgi:hypothetical protein
VRAHNTYNKSALCKQNNFENFGPVFCFIILVLGTLTEQAKILDVGSMAVPEYETDAILDFKHAKPFVIITLLIFTHYLSWLI